ncbi:MAG: hypothetical protein WCX08_03355 [Candidatus Buchananbacteria bacterium]|jgi:hypothetical protein
MNERMDAETMALADNGREQQLKEAIRLGILSEGATTDDLTPETAQKMLDIFTLRDCIGVGILPAGSSAEDLTSEVLQKFVDRNGGKTYRFEGNEIVFK